jgi:carboxylesterase
VRPITPGAEPFHFVGNGRVGVLLVHGFTGSPFEMRPIGEHLRERGVGSVGVLLRGHGTHPDDLLGCRYRDWLGDAEAGLERLLLSHRRVVLAGLSMGGTIALNIAARRADDPRVAGVVAMCAPLRLFDWRLSLVKVLSRVVRWHAWGKPDVKDTSAWERLVAYRRFRTPCIREVLGLLQETRALLPRVHQPLLVIQARRDNVVPPVNAEYIFSGVRSARKRLIWLENCYHVVTVDYDAPLVLAAVSDFVAGLALADEGTPAAAADTSSTSR